MDKQQAASYLGVSVRTLERFSSQGRIIKGRALRNKRAVVVFDEGALCKLKDELTEAGRSSGAGKGLPDKASDSVGFRLDPHYLETLAVEGKARGMSAGQYARSLVIQCLEQPASAKFAEELFSLKQALSEMFYLILVSKLGATESEAAEVVSGIMASSARTPVPGDPC